MITIPTTLKPTLNTLIRYYRKHGEDASFQAKNFILDEHGIEICDVTTLSKLENNRIQCMDDIYLQLLKKLGYRFRYDETINEIMQTSNHTLLKHAEVNDASKILSIIKRLNQILTPYKNCILYKEYSEIYELIYLYYEKQQFNKQQLDKYIELYDLIAEELKPIFISIAYHYYSRVNIEEFLSIELLEKSLDIKTDSIIKMYLSGIHLMRNNKLIELEQLAKIGVDICNKENNRYYLVRFYNLLAISHRAMNPDLSIHYLTLGIANFDEKVDQYENLMAFYHNMVQLAYDRKDYYSILYIYKRHLYDNHIIIRHFFHILINVIQNTTKDYSEINRIMEITYDSWKEISDFHKTIFEIFYTIYKEYSYERLASSIESLKTYKDYFINESPIKKALSDEIQKICTSENTFNLYHEYLDLFQ